MPKCLCFSSGDMSFYKVMLFEGETHRDTYIQYLKTLHLTRSCMSAIEQREREGERERVFLSSGDMSFYKVMLFEGETHRDTYIQYLKTLYLTRSCVSAIAHRGRVRVRERESERERCLLLIPADHSIIQL